MVPEYLVGFVARAREALARGLPHDPWIHLGHWSKLPAREPGPADLPAAQARLDAELRARLAAQPGHRVLDVGCGIGGTVAELAREVEGAAIWGLNVDPAQLEVARAAVGIGRARSVSWTLGDACALPFDAASFDRVIAVECAFHFASRARFYEEAARVLVPGGRLVLSDFIAPAGAPEPPPALAEPVRSTLGPFPDLAGAEGPPEALAAAAGLALTARDDATAATAPSFRCMLGGRSPAVVLADGAAPALERAVAALAELIRSGALRVEYLVLEKPALTPGA
jgi:MPBQ/MSBQ methyltransferase